MIVVAADHNLMWQGLRSLLAAEAEFHVVGEATDGAEPLAIVEQLRPNVLILDLMLPDLNGLEITRMLRASNAATRVITLSMHAAERYVRDALKSGAIGYVLKEASMEALALVLTGLTASAITERLSISPRTAGMHRANLLKKLGIHTQKELIRFALRHQFLPSEG